MTNQPRIRRSSKTPQVFNMSEQLCLWAQAGVVEPRLCHNAFDCMSCSFDKAMQRKKNLGWWAAGLDQPPGKGELWSKERWLQLPPSQRKCRHMLSGWVSVKYCPNAFQCSSCEYDEMQDQTAQALTGQKVDTVGAAGFELPPSYYFHPGHTWARLEYGGRVRVGLDDFAGSLFGPADEYRLPQLGDAVRGGGLELAFSRDGNLARAACPVEGVVVARNPALSSQRGLVTDSPYDQGWLLLLAPARLQKDLAGLMHGEDSREWMEEESGRLGGIINQETGHRLAATGGRVIRDIYGNLPGLDWNELTREFLQNR